MLGPAIAFLGGGAISRLHVSLQRESILTVNSQLYWGGGGGGGMHKLKEYSNLLQVVQPSQ